ncbi:hypothetical protein QJS04_geneDACA010394 [Acorus gramineus]|uniref:Bromo domain-containing protein n=1 Tax=Acorus gramineus TaxID=55184 RepID=A0AAV9A611_ACOGR|nr:hypothetical protein QJS04_geneDACA010394 [Acorus gramineus]
MTRSNGQGEIWGTLEELLLASAVHRHGTRSWDSVAMEVQNRISLALTPQSCKRKFYELRRRFEAMDHKIDGGDGVIGAVSFDMPWLDELRKLRVAELKREVQHHDLSIVSLQMKVKRLTEERERSVREGEGKADQAKDESEEGVDEPARLVGGGDSGRSCNDSKGTDPGSRSGEANLAEGVVGGAEPAAGDVGVDRPAAEASFNGSSDTIAKGAAASPPVEAAEPVENSDVQSSANLSGKGRRMKKRRVSSTSTAVDEAEADVRVGDGRGGGGGGEPSHVRRDRTVEKSKPLVDFLEIIRSHTYGSVFERRLEIQDSLEYKGLIKRHVDLETVRSKVEKGEHPPDQRSGFFRDLLLLFNNAIAFFPKGSSESVAAFELRRLVSKEATASVTSPASRSESEKEPQPSDDPPPEAKPAETDLIKDSLPPKRGPVLIACRKRSSISAKAAASSTVVEKPNLEAKEESKAETKKSSSGTRGLRTNKVLNPRLKQVSAEEKPAPPSPPPPTKAEKKEAAASAAAAAKKRSEAAKFLNRMKKGGGSSSSLKNSSVAPPSSTAAGGGGSRGDSKRGSASGGGTRKVEGLRHGSGGKKEAKSPAAKRGVGRPPKRAAPPPAKARGKRGREAEAKTAKQPPRKRGRR